MAAACSGLVLALGIAERRRSYAIAAALGARSGQLAVFVWSEAVFVVGMGIVFGVVIGWEIANVLVKILTGVFDPPPSGLTIPWAYLAITLGFTVAATIVGGTGALRAVRKPLPVVLRDL